jgi:uncharacterized protein
MLTDGEGIEILVAEQCLELLATARLGRIAVTVRAVPSIFPVDYRLVDGHVVFRAGGEGTLYKASANKVVAFEVDDVDHSWERGWSVVVVGVAREVKDPDPMGSALDRTPELWGSRTGSHVIAILPDLVSGRRFVTAA